MGTSLAWYQIFAKSRNHETRHHMDLVLENPRTLNERRNIHTGHHKGLPKPHFVSTISRNSTKNIPSKTINGIWTITDQGPTFSNLIDEQIINNLVENKLHKMWGWFTLINFCIPNARHHIHCQNVHDFDKHGSKPHDPISNIRMAHANGGRHFL